MTRSGLRISRILLIAVAIWMLAAGPAAALIPRFDYHAPAIVPGNSIGGIRVGMTRAEARIAWGKPDRCSTRSGLTSCQYNVPSHGPAGPLPGLVAEFDLKGGRVVAITIQDQAAALDVGKVRDRLSKLKTAKGIRILSPISRARHRYGIPITGQGEAQLSRATLKHKHRCTLFYAPEAPYKTITGISVGVCKSTSLLYF